MTLRSGLTIFRGLLQGNSCRDTAMQNSAARRPRTLNISEKS